MQKNTDVKKQPTCNCLIRHAITEEEREAVVERLNYSRSVGDGMGLFLGIAALGTCPSLTN